MINFQIRVIKNNHCLHFLLLQIFLYSCTPTHQANESQYLQDIKDQTTLCQSDQEGPQSNCQAVPGQFVYSEKFGGRVGETLKLNSFSLPNGVLSWVIPNGWIPDSFQLTAQDPNLLPQNIVAGTTIFSVNGSFTVGGGALAFCTENMSSDQNACIIKQQKFVYDLAFDNRSSLCDSQEFDGQTPLSSCWLDPLNAKLKISSSPISFDPLPTCGSGLLNQDCQTDSGFIYNQELGGRTLNCVDGSNSQACWLHIPSGTKGVSLSQQSSCLDSSSQLAQLNSATCATSGARYVYSAAFGGRNQDCSESVTSNCFINSPQIRDVYPNLVASHIKKGVTVFGITGSLDVAGQWNSGMHRNRVQAPLRWDEEASRAASLATTNGMRSSLHVGYRDIPKSDLDSEGHAPAHNFVNRVGWGNTSCGTTGTLAQRRAHCAAIFGSNATWNGETDGSAGQGAWDLITRTGQEESGMLKEVWRDARTGLLWSGLVGRNLSWCQASGADLSDGLCDGNTTSVCFERSGFDKNSDHQGGKAGLHKDSSPKVRWRLPTLGDYDVAIYNGLNFIFSDWEPDGEWTMTVSSQNSNQGWYVKKDLQTDVLLRSTAAKAVRCIGRGGSL